MSANSSLSVLSSPPRTRRRLTVAGVVQGVGFRPFVYGLAQTHGVSGFVGNDSQGVFIEVEGTAVQLDAFQQQLQTTPPPLSQIEQVIVHSMPPVGEKTFLIVHSAVQANERTLISPDVCVCDDCVADVRTPGNRRYQYPFTNCTNCGPRFTIIREMPYDRPLTSMAAFELCPDCQAEYDDPLDRRFHAQPNACPVCGPQLWLEEKVGEQWEGGGEKRAAMAAARQRLAAGQIVAVKGLGGFHLACDATNETAVQTLRQRKQRPFKPLAVMARDLDTVHQFAELSPVEERLLTSRERPIVLLRKKLTAGLALSIAPGNQMIGVMLPYTPLHLLLLAETAVLVMTSANRSSQPIIHQNEVARTQLASLADALLLHDRPIETRCDDAVLRAFGETVMLIRRSRGYAPFPVRLPRSLPPILAVGGELKASFCLTEGAYGYMSQHIGDMENWETLEAFETAVAHFQHLFQIQPEQIACDLHPGYLSTQWAHRQSTPVVAVQHHHAHVASLMAEHGLDGSRPVLGFTFDGTGYGPDGTIWGGELLLADYDGFERLSHLDPFLLAGGDAAVKRPYRLALALLWAAGIKWEESLPPVVACSETERRLLGQQLAKQINTVPTSSLGRLFDAVAALAGGRQQVTYEGQAAIELESLVDPSIAACYHFETQADGSFTAVPVITAVVHDIHQNVPLSTIAAKFHNGLAQLIIQLATHHARQTGIHSIALTGGVFQNITLLDKTVRGLTAAGLTPLFHQRVPANDGGLALGQAMIAGKNESARRLKG